MYLWEWVLSQRWPGYIIPKFYCVLFCSSISISLKKLTYSLNRIKILPIWYIKWKCHSWYPLVSQLLEDFVLDFMLDKPTKEISLAECRHHNGQCISVLVWAGFQLIFFTVSGIRLCCVFVLEMEQFPHRDVSRAYTEPSPFLHLALPVSRLGVHKVWRGTQPGQLTQNDQRDIPHHVASGSAHQVAGRKGLFVSDGVCLFKQLLGVMEPGFYGDGWTPACPWKW